MAGQISAFAERMDELEKSKFILADKKICGVLKSIVGTPELLGLIKECLTGFDFEAEFRSAHQPSQSEYSNRFSLRLPADKKKLIAFVFCLFADFDTKRRDLHQFLQDYFYEDGSVYESYKKFIFTVVMPFRKTVESLFEVEEIESEEQKEAEKFFDGENIAVDNMVVEELIGKIQDISTFIANDDNFNHTEKREMIDITEGLGNAIITRETRLIKLLWIGFKHTFKEYKLLQSQIAAIEGKMKEYRIVD